jgi:hypothetical protein
MPTSRPGYIYDGTEWIPVGTQPNTTPVKIQATAPSTPQTGDIWVDTSTYIPSIDPSTFATKEELALVNGESDQIVIALQVFR